MMFQQLSTEQRKMMELCEMWQIRKPQGKTNITTGRGSGTDKP